MKPARLPVTKRIKKPGDIPYTFIEILFIFISFRKVNISEKKNEEKYELGRRLNSSTISSLKNRTISYIIFSLQNPINILGAQPIEEIQAGSGQIFSQPISDLINEGANESIFQAPSSKSKTSIYTRIKPLPPIPNFSCIIRKNFEVLENTSLVPAKYSKIEDDELDCLTINGIQFLRNFFYQFDYPYAELKTDLRMDIQIILLCFVNLNKPFINDQYFQLHRDTFFEEKHIYERNRLSLYWIASDFTNAPIKFESNPKALLEETQNIKDNACAYLGSLRKAFKLETD